MTQPERKNMRMRYGVHRVLEDAADAIIYAEVRKIKRHSENDILTPWKEKDRRRHEIYVPGGVPDAANRLGIYHRSTNPGRPELNSREGVARSGAHRVPRLIDYYSEAPRGTSSAATDTPVQSDSLRAFVQQGWDDDE